MYQGKVKWFNNAKGYGFIVEDGCSEDLFAHFSSIQMEGYKTLKAGQAVTFDKQPSGKGIHAVSISALESLADNTDSAAIDNEVISVADESSPILEQQESSAEQTTEQRQKAASI
jgi:CspA family cold shock protein